MCDINIKRSWIINTNDFDQTRTVFTIAKGQ